MRVFIADHFMNCRIFRYDFALDNYDLFYLANIQQKHHVAPK